MLRVVRARRVRAIDERYYGRTGRTIHVRTTRPPRFGRGRPAADTAGHDKA
jgi:hypothetical protein